MALAGFANLTNLIYAFEHQTPPTPGEDILAPLVQSFLDGSDYVIDGSDGDRNRYAGYGVCASAEYIAIPAGKNIVFDLTGSTAQIESPHNAFYDSSKAYKGKLTLSYGEVNTITPPSGAAYFRLTLLQDDLSPTQKITIYFA